MKRIRNLDNLKTTMMVLVVYYHCCLFWSDGWFVMEEPVFPAPYLSILARWLNTFHVQTFTFAVGFLFYYQKKYFGKHNVLLLDVKKRFFRLLVPYFFTMLFWAIPFYAFFDGFNAREIMRKYVLGIAPSQLWFLLMLFWEFLAFWFIFKHTKPTLWGLISVFLGSTLMGSILGKLGINYYQIGTAVRYSLFYYLGAYCCEKDFKISLIKGVLASAASIILFALVECLSPAKETSILVRITVLFLNKFTSVAGIIMMYIWVSLITYRMSDIQGKTWNTLTKNSFGIFLFHQQLIYLSILVFNGLVHPIIQSLLSLVVVLAVSSVMISVLRKNRISRFMFGI